MIYFLFFLIFAEGYVVLATELLAVRLTIPMVGAGTDTVSIIIAGVLIPLAFGYYAGGNYRARPRTKGRGKTLRQKLLSGDLISTFRGLFHL